MPKTDSFLPSNLVTGLPSPKAITSDKSTSYKTHIAQDDTFQNKFEALGVSTDLGASFLAGMVTLFGAGGYLVFARLGKQHVEGAVCLEIATEKVSLGPRHIEPVNVSADAFDSKNATHVVVGIVFGVKVVFGARLPSQEDKLQTQHQMDTKLSSLRSWLDRRTSATTSSNIDHAPLDTLDEHLDDMNYAIFSDLTDWERIYNLSVKDKSELMNDLPNALKRADYGRGDPIAYSLVPIEYMRLMLGVPSHQQAPVQQPAGALLRQFIHFFDQWQEVERDIKNFQEKRMTATLPCTDPVINLLERTLKAKSSMRDGFREALKHARGAADPNDALTRILHKYCTSTESPKAVQEILAKEAGDSEFKAGVTGNGGQYTDFAGAQRAVSVRSNIYIKYSTEDMKREKTSWEANQRIIYNLLKRNPGDYLVAVAECKPKQLAFNKARVTFYSRGEATIHDMLDNVDLVDQAFARYDAKSLDTTGCHHPTNRRPVSLACPGKNCNQNTLCSWTCYKCRVPLKYSDEFIYCDCGRAPTKAYSWQCNSDNHGSGFTKYRLSKLGPNLQALGSYKEVNILLLGEMGVGKSTFINAFYNYIFLRDA
ncbi:Uu.00g120460.m01.CDS01 [Anthostomella pinea]|uniref:Uu.00g120460.m01.CDS01 n=1 Tax=Anthostomella pinea TaxID=933095 RepID=A0AAI8YHC7_9PEZI|nr:Uu.00g120460.m01.CDS01 [Anthostomella pinea]